MFINIDIGPRGPQLTVIPCLVGLMLPCVLRLSYTRVHTLPAGYTGVHISSGAREQQCAFRGQRTTLAFGPLSSTLSETRSVGCQLLGTPS